MSTTRSEPASWWVAGEDRADAVPGLLVFDEASNPTIHLHKPLPGLEDNPMFAGLEELPVFPLIHGITMDEHWTLLDSRIESGQWSWKFDRMADIVLRPRVALSGDFLLSKPELNITRVRISLWDQDDWTGWIRSVNITNRDQASEAPLSIVHVPPSPVISSLPGAQVSLLDDSWGFAAPNSKGVINVRANSAWQLDFDQPSSIPDLFTQWIEPLIFLTTTATRRKTGLSRMAVWSSQWHFAPGSVQSEGLRVYAQSGSRPEGDIPSFGLLHQLSDWDLERQLPMVFAFVWDHNFAVDQYLSYRNSSGYTYQMQFAVLYQVIETLDRSLNAKDDTVDAGVTQDALEALGRAIQAEPLLQKLAKRLQWTVKHAGDPNLAKRLSRLDSQVNNFISNELSSREWKSDLAALRNGVAHGLDSAKAIVTDAGPLGPAPSSLSYCLRYAFSSASASIRNKQVK